MLKKYRDYRLYEQSLKSYNEIELTDREKIILESWDKDLLKKVQDLSYRSLMRDLLNEELPRDYVLWYKHAISHFISYFRKYKLK